MTEKNVPFQMKVLLVDDDRKLCRLVQEYLKPMGYEVDAVHTGREGLEKALTGEYHVMILDVMMPGMDGFEVLKSLRKQSDMPVLMLTARGDETDRIVGLEVGADDYLPKTFSTRELLARLRAVTRRYYRSGKPDSKENPEEIIVVKNLRIHPGARAAHLDDELLNLTPIEYDLLVSLVRAAGRVLTRDQLLDSVAGRSYDVFDRSIDVHISSLRRKLNDDPRDPVFIKTIRSAGYMFCIPEEELP